MSRGHTILRNTMIELFRQAGHQVDPEQAIPGRDERPADMLVSNWSGKTLAVDFTVVTPSRASAVARGAATSSSTLMDQTAQLKHHKSRQLCQAHGWEFMPFVADAYGALRTDARDMVSTLIQRHHTKFAPLTEAEVGRAVWSTVSAAAVARAAMQLSRMLQADRPLGMDIDGLNLRTARACDVTALVRSQAPAPQQEGMGILPHQQPGQPVAQHGATTIVSMAVERWM